MVAVLMSENIDVELYGIVFNIEIQYFGSAPSLLEPAEPPEWECVGIYVIDVVRKNNEWVTENIMVSYSQKLTQKIVDDIEAKVHEHIELVGR